jgi:hypothetical protein
LAPLPTAVANAPLASAWQGSVLSRKVVVLFCELPDWHPALAGAVERIIAPAAKAQLANTAKRCRRSEWMGRDGRNKLSLRVEPAGNVA